MSACLGLILSCMPPFPLSLHILTRDHVTDHVTAIMSLHSPAVADADTDADTNCQIVHKLLI